MINEQQARKFCSDDISLIENYKEAVADKTQTWHIHHRRETDEGLSARELIKRKEYRHRHADELIFLTKSDHHRLHNLGKKYSEETCKKIAEAHSGEKNYFFGKHLSEDHKKKLSKAKLGNTNVRGKHWYNNGTKSIRAKSCPDGFKLGRLSWIA